MAEATSKKELLLLTDGCTSDDDEEEPLYVLPFFASRRIEDLQTEISAEQLRHLWQEEQSLTVIPKKVAPPFPTEKKASWPGSLSQLSAFVDAVKRQEGRDLMVRDDVLARKVGKIAQDTERLSLEARVNLAGSHSPKRFRKRARSAGDVTASVTLAARQFTLQRTYYDDENRIRRRPLMVLDLGDDAIDTTLRRYVDFHAALANACPIYQKPLLVIFTDAREKKQLQLLAKLKLQVRALEEQAILDQDISLKDAARSVIFLDPRHVLAGVHPDTSHELLQTVLKRSSVSGFRHLQHLTAKSDAFSLRIHKTCDHKTQDRHKLSSTSFLTSASDTSLEEKNTTVIMPLTR